MPSDISAILSLEHEIVKGSQFLTSSLVLNLIAEKRRDNTKWLTTKIKNINSLNTINKMCKKRYDNIIPLKPKQKTCSGLKK